MTGFEVVICGGGIAGVEGLLRLRRLAGDRVQVTLVSPEGEFVYRPLAVREPFGLEGARRYPLGRIVSDAGATWVRDRAARIDGDARTVQTEGGREVSYDALLLAVGGRESSPFEHAQLFTDRDADQSFRGIVREIELGQVRSVAFVLPNDPVWPVPLYELAVMTAERARSTSRDVQITLITPEARPLKAFGQAGGDTALGRRGTSTDPPAGHVWRHAIGGGSDRHATQDQRSRRARDSGRGALERANR